MNKLQKGDLYAKLVRRMEFNQYIEIVDGKLIHDEEITFDDYVWECPEPDLGG